MNCDADRHAVANMSSFGNVEDPVSKLDISLERLWWNTNVPREEWTEECPEFLKDQPEKNILILSTLDLNYPLFSWEVTNSLIDTNRIDHFHRRPKELRRYIRYCDHLRRNHGSILQFMQHTRLQWPTMDPSPDPPFQNKSDYKILFNDWPYAIDPQIVHLVVWTKFVLEDDVDTGELKAEFKETIEEFVTRTFCDGDLADVTIDRDKLRWFKNWRRLRSVHALEHFHIMLYDPPAQLVHRVTNGDRPAGEQFE